MRRAAAIGLLLGLAAIAAPPPAAEGSCAAAVVVDGRILWGFGDPYRAAAELPPRGPEREAVLPACTEGPDRSTTVGTFRGVPAQVAVLLRGDIYLTRGTLTTLASHPLHEVMHGDARARRPRRCDERETLRGEVAQPPSRALVLATAAGERRARLHPTTRIANRPAYEPVRPGQRLAVTASRCGGRLVAERIRFVGATVAAPRYEPGGDDGLGWGGIAALGVAAALLLGFGFIVAAPRRDLA